ncbi:glycosyl transferase [Treponema sp. TIM-1]|uniref:glycosyltransferase n=1 Tax=Treponema sp. TIM-1 TaxID=2898417 RepID=UPI003980267B
MKYLYVLTSSKNDTYYEQFLLSLVSLRMHHSHDEVVVLTDTKTKESLTGKRGRYEKLVSDIKPIDPPNELNQKEISRWIKTSIRHFVSGDFLFIDCDTIIAGLLDILSLQNITLGSVLDTHVLLSQHHLNDEFKKRDVALGYIRERDSDKYFNSGIIFSRDTPEAHVFFNKWHDLWIEGNSRGISADQPSFNQANYELNNIITELPGEWNCQISHNGLPYLCDAKIIHYYATSLVSFVPAYKLASPEILASIKATGEIPKAAMAMLENPKAAFESQTRIIADPVVIGAFDGSLFSKLIWLNKRHPKLFKKCDDFMSRLTKIIKKLLGKK